MFCRIFWKWEKTHLALQYNFSNSHWCSSSLVQLTGGQGFKCKGSFLNLEYGCIIFKIQCKVSLKNIKCKVIYWWETDDTNCGIILAKKLSSYRQTGLWWAKTTLCIWGTCSNVRQVNDLSFYTYLT